MVLGDAAGASWLYKCDSGLNCCQIASVSLFRSNTKYSAAVVLKENLFVLTESLETSLETLLS